jgi:hypothetical protein
MSWRENDWQPEPPTFAYNIRVRDRAHASDRTAAKLTRAASAELSKTRIIIDDITGCPAPIGT